MEALLQAALEAEMTEAIGAEQRGAHARRVWAIAAAIYSRSLITRVGTLELRVPQDRSGRFSTELFERYQRSEKALVGALAEMYVQGVSTRKVKAVTEAVVRPQLLGLVDQRDEQDAWTTALTAFADAAAGRAVSLPDTGCPLRAGARRRGDRQPGGADRHRGRRDGRRQVLAVELANRESRVELAGLPAGAEAARAARRGVRGLGRSSPA